MTHRVSLFVAGLALLWSPIACSFQNLDSFGQGGGASGSGGTGGTVPDSGGSGGSHMVGGSDSGGTSGDTGQAGQAGSMGSAGSGSGEQGLLEDPSFENGHAGWIGFGGSLIEDVTSNPHSGLRAIVSRNRTQNWNGPSIRLVNTVEQGQNYTVSAWLRTDGETYSGNDAVTISTKVICENMVPDAGVDSTEEYTPRGSLDVTGQWSQIQGSFNVPVCDNLVEFLLYFQGPPPDARFYLDDVVLLPLE